MARRCRPHRADSTRPGLLHAAASRPLADSGSSAEAGAGLNSRISLGVAMRSSTWFGLLEADRRSSANVHPRYLQYAELPTYDGNCALIGSWIVGQAAGRVVRASGGPRDRLPQPGVSAHGK